MSQNIINDITELNPVAVDKVITPTSAEEIANAVKSALGSVSIGGGRFSMGGQTAYENSLHIDMRQFNKIVDFSTSDKTIRVQTGITWREIQEHIDKHDLSVKIMQTYANFTVGGSLSVNVHGRYIGLGPLILSVKSIAMILADGSLVETTPEANKELFYAAIGGYGGLGIIVEATLELEDNIKVERSSVRMPRKDYLEYFKANIRKDTNVAFHNGDIYPPHYNRVNAVTWSKTENDVTVKQRLQPVGKNYPLHRYFFWAFTETPFGKWRREHIIDPIIFSPKNVHWRNYEASYDVAELQPISSKSGTFVLQEYFAPIDKFNEFVDKASEILQRHDVNVVNISIRHAKQDSGAYLAWAREESFAFVLYYKQRTGAHDKNKVAVWTRELVDAAISCNGAHYLPYQPHATVELFHKAYPKASDFFVLKDKYDPDFKFRNSLWNKYYKPEPEADVMQSPSEFIGICSNDVWADKLYRFLQVVFNLNPEDKFFTLIKEACSKYSSDEEIYNHIFSNLKTIKPKSQLTKYILPAIRTQKEELTKQTLELLGDRQSFDGYLEMGSTGFYLSELQKHLDIKGNQTMMDYIVPSYSPADILKRGQISKFGKFVDLDNYNPISAENVPDNSCDLVTCYIGLHHCPPKKLDAFIASIARIMRKDGYFILRDHAVDSPEMDRFVSLIHTVFNAGTDETWETNKQELRFFNTIEHWSQSVQKHGFEDLGKRILQKNDPSDNVLMAFRRV
ncbi:MAG: FAD-binding protein [Proteobacteria bacterium]|nr:FAD-binding protein [Pseudomonadota bacterium]MDA0967351.1 FAD-binding protein [Pseudomonadota bacterium]